MKKRDIIRAWRDAEYYQSLSESERAQLPAHPAGLTELTDEDLDGIAGGTHWGTLFSCQGTVICTPCEGYVCA